MAESETVTNPLLVSASPHIHSPESVRRIMWSVVVCLSPAGIWGVIIFGWYAGAVIAVSVVTACITEALVQKLRKADVTIADGSAVVTGMLLAYVLPPNVPLYVPVVGAFVAIAIAKQAFGGLGYNIWNPALVGRAFVQLAYGSVVNLSRWPMLVSGKYFWGNITRTAGAAADATTQPSPLANESLEVLYRAADRAAEFVGYGTKGLFLGTVPGCIGEVSALLILVGGIYLLARKYIKWQVPAVYIAVVAALTFALPVHKSGFASGGLLGGYPVYQIFSGGLFLGAFFMATDMVTTPLTVRGNIIFAVGCGLLTALIRLYGGYPEGVCYSILLMNTATPLIDRFTRPRQFGGIRRER
jgi:electron transport complex protein RnfD